MIVRLALTGLTILLTGLTVQAHEHILCGLTPGEYNVGAATETRGSEPAGILSFNHDCPVGPCTVTIARENGGPTANGCECGPRVAAGCAWPESVNSAYGFYHELDGAMVGYVEIRAGVYWTAGGASFGWRTGEVRHARVCVEGGDWLAARAQLGAPLALEMTRPMWPEGE